MYAMDGVEIKYCHACNVYREAPTGHHCRQCNYCVTGFDHHCVLLGVCVARRNRQGFVLLLLNNTMSCFMAAYAALVSMTDIYYEHTINLIAEQQYISYYLGHSIGVHTHIYIYIYKCVFMF